MKKAVFPGSFDPITLGHVDIINKGLGLFDQIIVAIGINADKNYMWSLEDRITFIENAFANNPNVIATSYEGLTAEFCKQENAPYILRGLRNSLDFSYEKSIAQTNSDYAGIETVFIISSPKYSHISSSIVRDIARNGGDISNLVPFTT